MSPTSSGGTPKKAIAKKTRKVKQPRAEKLTKKQRLKEERSRASREVWDESHTREEARELLTKALRRPDGSAMEHEVDARAMAEKIEQALFSKHSESAATARYDAQLFSLLLNLSSVQNAALRDSLLGVQLYARDLVEMRVEDLANPELVKSRFDAAEWAKTVSMARSLNAGEPTRAYTCGRCGKNECNSMNLQTRSADEGFTTFVTCVSCGHRWRN